MALFETQIKMTLNQTITSTTCIVTTKREHFTVWKLQNFSVTHILREINFGDFKSAKYAILSQLKALNFDFYDFLHFWKAENYQINKIPSL